MDDIPTDYQTGESIALADDTTHKFSLAGDGYTPSSQTENVGFGKTITFNVS